MNTEILINRLEKVRSSGNNRWVACCPAHEDKSPSLQITQTGERILIHCFAGCGANDVLSAIGLDFDALYPDGEYTKKVYVNPVDEIYVNVFKSKVSNGDIPTAKDKEKYREILAKKYKFDIN